MPLKLAIQLKGKLLYAWHPKRQQFQIEDLKMTPAV